MAAACAGWLAAAGSQRDSAGRQLRPYAGLDAAEALQQEWVDAAFIIAAPEAPVVQVLLRSPGVRVMSFVQADAYTRRFPFLTRSVCRAAWWIWCAIRRQGYGLLAATANLVVNEKTHPALVSLLQAATEVHGKSGFFQRTGDFPAYLDTSFELSDDAKRYYKSGPPFLQRYLPFWAAVFVDRMVVLLLPLVALLLPLMRIAPAIYSWRIRSRCSASTANSSFSKTKCGRITRLPATASFSSGSIVSRRRPATAMPLAFTDLVTLREHINLVRKQLLRMEAMEASGGAEEGKSMKAILVANPKGVRVNPPCRPTWPATWPVAATGSCWATPIASNPPATGWRSVPACCRRLPPGRSKTIARLPPPGTSHAVLDTPAGLHGKALERVLKAVHRVIVPVQPSLFDILATRSFSKSCWRKRRCASSRPCCRGRHAGGCPHTCNHRAGALSRAIRFAGAGVSARHAALMCRRRRAA